MNIRKRGNKLKKYIWVLMYGLILFIFTVYVLLDTFVVAKVYVELPKEQGDGDQVSAEIGNYSDRGNSDNQENITSVQTENSYNDGNISVTLTEYRKNNTTIYVADVQLKSADYLKTALAQNVYGRNITEKTSDIAQANNAILAINGDFYGSREKGYVLRNGVLYRETASSGNEDLVVYADGSFEIIEEKSVSADELKNNGAKQIFSFGPALLSGGEICVSKNDEVGKAMADNPRTAIGIIDELHYVLVVSDGRTNKSEGLTLYELAEFMQSIGVKIAYNLDGGGSSTMYFNGKVINNPTTNGKSIKERSVSDIVYIGY